MDDLVRTVRVETKRDQGVLAWLNANAGGVVVAEAARSLVRDRGPYLSNVAKRLRLQPPKSLAFATKADVLKQIAEIAALLGDR